MARRKQIEEEPEAVSSISPLAAVVWSAAAIAFALVAYNIFLGQSQRAIELAQGKTSPKTLVAAADSATNTITMHYDPQVEEVQRLLFATGHYKGLVDGVNGRQTQDAIFAYQRDNKLNITNGITPELIDHIKYTRKLFDAAQFTGSTGAAQPVAGDPIVAKVQNALTEMGYDTGDTTGVLDSITHAAIAKFEQDNKLPVDGEIDRRLIAELGRVTGDEALLKLAN